MSGSSPNRAAWRNVEVCCSYLTYLENVSARAHVCIGARLKELQFRVDAAQQGIIKGSTERGLRICNLVRATYISAPGLSH